ncbi:hypothetical protein ACEWY4_015849 [Coilia grayii]|uniref:Schlafen AlbA-2 domain-containing protein n=1 Tax=Coilia grayii TaxID=363190 RepID=A0ABD1JQ19_9TELE
MDSPYLNVTTSQDFPDIELKCSKRVTFGESARKGMDKAKRQLEKECILNGVCALMNSGGGIMIVDVANSAYDYKKEGRGLDIEHELKDLVDSQIEDMIEFIPQGDRVYIYVRSWHAGEHRPRLCSINTGLWERTGSNDERIYPSNVSKFLEKKKDRAKRKQKEDEGCPSAKRYAPLPGNDIIKLKADEFYMRDWVNSGEHLEFGESLHVELKHFGNSENLYKRLREVVPKNISAFANTDGGYMFIGIHDTTQKVIGCGHKIEAAELLRMVQELCEKPKAVHISSCNKNTGLSPECRLIKVKAGKSSEADGYVIAIKIPAFCCAVFDKDPNSWHTESERVVKLEAASWLKKMQLADPEDDLCERFQNVLSLQNAPPLCKPVYSIQELTQLQEKLFPVPESGVIVVPEAFRDRFTSVGLLTDSLKGPGICILSPSWAVDVNLPKNEDVMYEALIVHAGSYPTLCCVVERASPELWKYARDTAFHLKQQLVNLGGYTGKLCVIPQLVETQTQNLPEMNGNLLYPNSYRLNQENDLKTLLHSLVVVLLRFTSALSDEVGCEFLNLLTEEQFKILQNLGGIKKLFIHGVPGSGKTLIAIELMQRIKNLYGCEKRNILYLCENVGLREFVRYQNLCQSETRVKFMSQDFPEVKHIIVDEAQNFRMEDGDWYEKAKGIVGEDGMFWVFLDYYQKNHRFSDGLPSLTSQNKVELHKVVRNSAKILHAMQCQMTKVVSGPQFPVTKYLAGIYKKMELSHSFQGTFVCREIPPKKVLKHVIQLLQHLSSHGHSAGDIAVLFPTQEHLEAEMFKIPFPFSHVSEMNPKMMVLDTVRRFSGLERNIVILVNPSVHPYLRDIEANFFISAYSRARIRLYHIKTKVSE